DGQVRIFWAQIGDAAGLAGPDFGDYDENRGYFPYFDGVVKLNQDPSTWDNDEELVSTLTHEFGHLIGLGHSENPLSIMYANPYNNLNHPREDDIRAAQALYGAGTSTVDPAAGVSAWRYTIPPVAPA
ncbi:MAG: matrixin family metalloprotease, partial [Pseudomonadota bacterium]